MRGHETKNHCRTALYANEIVFLSLNVRSNWIPYVAVHEKEKGGKVVVWTREGKMKNNLDHYPHRTDAHNHPKFKILRRHFGWEGEGRFWALNNMIADSENCQYDLSKPYNKLSLIADLGFQDEQELDEFIEFLISENCALIYQEGNFLMTHTTREALSVTNANRYRARDYKIQAKSKKGYKKLQKVNRENEQTKLNKTKLNETKRNTHTAVLTTLEIHEENNSSPETKESEGDISGLIKIQDAESTTITESEYKNLIKQCGKKNADLLLHEIHVQQMKTNQQYPSTYWTAVQWFEKRVREGKIHAPNTFAQKSEEKMERCNQCQQVFRAALVTYNKGVCLECHKKNLQS